MGISCFSRVGLADHNELYFMHHYSTGKPVALIKLTRAQLGEFTPIRSVDVPAPRPHHRPSRSPRDASSRRLRRAPAGAGALSRSKA